MDSHQFIIEETNLSEAWLIAMNRTIKTKNGELTPLLLTLTGFEENMRMRNILDTHLKKNNCGSVQTVSETIFPQTLYKMYKYNRFALYDGYREILPRLKKIDASSNGRGTYFERLIAFDNGKTKINQLEIILSALGGEKRVRRSKAQASIFDPTKDHLNRPYQRFPCLQHVTFYISKEGGLVVNSFYAIQYIYERAYGNWLGLINLGKFIAHELGIGLERFNCYIGVEKLDLKKGEARELIGLINK